MKRTDRLLTRLRAGQTLCHMIRRSEVGDEHVYWLEPSGDSVGEWTVNRALSDGLIVEAGDGLFEFEGITQTYRVADARS